MFFTRMGRMHLTRYFSASNFAETSCSSSSPDRHSVLSPWKPVVERYWAREIGKQGHTVRLIPPKYVMLFIKRQKNDAADAQAICGAAQHPTMRFVALKSEEHQANAAFGPPRTAIILSFPKPA